MRSIDIVFDEAADAAVRADWQTLADAGFPSLASHAGASNRPHITLAAGNELELAERPQFEPLEIELGGVILFPRKSGFVLARAVVPTTRLLELHARVLAATTGATEHTQVGRWTPHVSLSRRLSAEQVGPAAQAIARATSGTAIALRWWDSETATVSDLR